MYGDRITVDPKIMLGKPIIKGTRTTVQAILQKLAEGYTADELLEVHPTLKKEDILAALAYSADVVGREEIVAR